MRVSKVVREYIEKKVWEKFPKSEEEIVFNEIADKVNSANSEYSELMDKAKEQIVQQLVEKYGLVDDIVRRKVGYAYLPFDTWGSQVRLDSESAKSKRRALAVEKIEHIIVELELGGTKADLEKMLAEI